jgi:hypothetical protein
MLDLYVLFYSFVFEKVAAHTYAEGYAPGELGLEGLAH